MGGRPADDSGMRPTAVRTVSRPGPLVARTDLVEPARARQSVRARPGRIRRFVRRYGWRAYAVPLLTLATLIALVDLALTTPATTTAATSGAAATSLAPAEPSQVPVPAPEAQPPAPAEGDAGPSPVPQVLGAETYVEQGAGTVSVVDGSSQVSGTGPLRRRRFWAGPDQGNVPDAPRCGRHATERETLGS